MVLCEFWQVVKVFLVPFKELVHFIYIIKLVGVKLFIVFLYYSFNVYEICNIYSFIYNISSLCSLFFFFLLYYFFFRLFFFFYLFLLLLKLFVFFVFFSLAGGLLILLIFSSNFERTLFSLISSTNFLVFVSLISTLFLTTFSLHLAFDLICTSFSGFLS